MRFAVPEGMLTAMKNRSAVALGRKGGLARKAKLTPARRSEIARKAATARWARRKP